MKLEDEDNIWPDSKTINSPPQEPLYSVLRWILDQINVGCAEFIDEPHAHTVVIGQRASYYETVKEAIEHAQKRSLAVSSAGVLATARERGVEPKYEGLTKKAKLSATENFHMNTEFHYAYKLVDILENIGRRTFVFDAPPIVGRAEPHTLDLLQEATRCYLFGLHRACVAICRTVLEASLRQRVPESSQMAEKMQSSRKDGELQILINAAVRARVLPQELSSMAHDIRHKANLVLHQADRDVPDLWKLLLDTRTIVEKVYT